MPFLPFVVTAWVGLATPQDGVAPPLVVATSFELDFARPLVDRFRSAHPEHTVELVELGSRVALERLRGEATARERVISVWWGGDDLALEEAAEAGLLEPSAPAWAASLPLALRRPDGRWLALYTVPAALVHKPACQDLPATFEDLADPRYRSRLLLLAPSKSEAMRRWLGVVFTSRLSRRIPLERSLDWGAMLYVNQVDAEFTDDAELLARLAAKDSPAGEIAILPATEAVKARDADGLGVKLTFLAGAPASLEGIARVAEAPNAEAAAQFIEFAGMDEAAREAARRGRIPATRAAGLRPPPGLTLDLDVDLGDRAQLVRGLPAWMEQLERRVRLGVGELPEADDPNYWLFNVIDVVGTVTIIAVIVTLLRRGKFKALTARAEAEPQARVPGESSP